MDKDYDKYNKGDNRKNDIVFSKAIKAGKRIYYLDVRKNQKNELFLAITESKRLETNDKPQSVQYEKHKIFLYKEDFDKLLDGLTEMIGYIRANNSTELAPQKNTEFINAHIDPIIEEEIICN
jgi:hypothetical protein